MTVKGVYSTWPKGPSDLKERSRGPGQTVESGRWRHRRPWPEGSCHLDAAAGLSWGPMVRSSVCLPLGARPYPWLAAAFPRCGERGRGGSGTSEHCGPWFR